LWRGLLWTWALLMLVVGVVVGAVAVVCLPPTGAGAEARGRSALSEVHSSYQGGRGVIGTSAVIVRVP